MVGSVGGISVLDGLVSIARVGVARPSAGLRPAAPVAPHRESPQRDRVEISAEARQAAGPAAGEVQEKRPGREDQSGESVTSADDSAPRRFDELNDEQKQQVRELRRRDHEVRAHEQAHKAAAGPYGGPISFTYATGPDGRRYATGGEVPVDLSLVDGDPQATIRKMQQVRRAALAPAEPSAADRSVAARAQQIEREARAQTQQPGSVEEPIGSSRGLVSPAQGPARSSRIDMIA